MDSTTNRLLRFNDERQSIVSEVVERVVAITIADSEKSNAPDLEYTLNDVAFAEIQRYQKQKNRRSQKKEAEWRQFALSLSKLDTSQKVFQLNRLANIYATDVAGNFNPKIYRLAKDVVPSALSVLLSPVRSIKEGVEAFGKVAESVRVEGAVDQVKQCAQKGTIVLTPTHTSNLDSVIIGLALQQTGLPAVTYGAGKNLFTNPLLGFFMQNLGAYKVDRRLQFGLYKQTLKVYSQILIERGYHSLFFPGGTRCRSNRVESRLKLGLLGSALSAYQNQLGQRDGRPVYIVPLTLNYQIVLEAESLINDHLVEDGRSAYFLENDEFGKIGKVIEFLRKTLVHQGEAVIRLGTPLDALGHQVDEHGVGVDKRGRQVALETFFMNLNGSVDKDSQRNQVYTQQCGKAIAESFLENTVFMSTVILSRAVYQAAKERFGTKDIYRILRVSTTTEMYDFKSILRSIDSFRKHVASDGKIGSIDSKWDGQSSESIAEQALKLFEEYHTQKVCYRVGNDLRVSSMDLIYYYQSRAAHVPEVE